MLDARRNTPFNVSAAFRTLTHYVSALGVRQTVKLQAGRVLGGAPIELQVRGLVAPIVCRAVGSDRIALSQALIQRDSDVQLEGTPRFIIDGGANVGYASVLFANKYPTAQIWAVEPEPGNLKMAAINTRPYKNVKIVPGGLWSSDSGLLIENPTDQSDSFRVIEAPLGTPGSIDGYSIGSLLAQSGFDTIDLLKLDIEGAEKRLFSQPPFDWISRVKVFVIETHGSDCLEAVEHALGGLAFERSQLGEKLAFRRRAS